MPVEFHVFGYNINGELKLIGEGKLPDTKSSVHMKRPKGKIDFGGKEKPEITISLEGYPPTRGELVANIPATIDFPLVINRIPYFILKMWSISLLFNPGDKPAKSSRKT